MVARLAIVPHPASLFLGVVWYGWVGGWKKGRDKGNDVSLMEEMQDLQLDELIHVQLLDRAVVPVAVRAVYWDGGWVGWVEGWRQSASPHTERT